jgi:hypothetical protein
MPRNIKDRNSEVYTTRALPTADGTVTSSDLDLGVRPYDLESIELLISVPELSATNLPSADTLTITVQSGSSATPSTSLNLVKVITGTGSTIAAQEVRFRLPSTTERYVLRARRRPPTAAGVPFPDP